VLGGRPADRGARAGPVGEAGGRDPLRGVGPAVAQHRVGVPSDLADRLWKLLEVQAGSRFSTLERLRTAPARVSGPAMVTALERAAEVAGVGAGTVDVSGAPATRLAALARYGVTAKAAAL